MNNIILRYIISTVVSFATGFFGYLLIAMEAGDTFADISWQAVLLGGAYAGLRLVIKTIVELLPKLILLINKK